MTKVTGLRNLNANIKKAGQLVQREAAKTLNKIGKKAMEESTAKVAKDVGVPSKTIRGRAQAKNATSRNLFMQIRVNRSNMPAVRLFEKRRNKMWIGGDGIVIGKYAIQRGFVQKLANGRTHVMQRAGRKRYSIAVVKIPLSGKLTTAFNQSLADYPQEIRKELRERLQVEFTKNFQ